MELYVHIFKLRNIRASYNPPTAQDSVRALSSDEVGRASYNPPTAQDSVRALSSDKVGGRVGRLFQQRLKGRRSYQKATRTNLLLHPNHSTLLVSYKDDSSVAARILHCQRCLSYNLTTPSRANCGLNRARTAHATQSLSLPLIFQPFVRQHSVDHIDEHNTVTQF